LSALFLSLTAGQGWAQGTATPAATDDQKNEEIIVLSPFEVSATEEGSYTAATTLAGNRLNTQLRDLGNAVQVITGQFLKDIGATDNQTLLQYTTNTEVGSVYGNFAGAGDTATLDESPHFTNPNQNTRVRGLTSADNTRDYFLTDIPWEGYNIDGVDLQRGPNSILFGQGSPAGIINTRTKQAGFKNSNEVTFRVGSFGSTRATLDINRVLIKNELALRLAAVRGDEQFKQEPAFSRTDRVFAATRWEPGFLKKSSARTIFKANIEWGRVRSNNPRDIPPIDKITPWFRTGTFSAIDAAGNPATYPYLNKLTVTPQQNVDGNTGLPNHGQSIGIISSVPNQWYQPWIANFGNQFGNPIASFNNDSAAPLSPYIVWEPRTNGGIGTDGKIDNGVGGINFQRPAGIAGYAQFAKNARMPYSGFGVYKDKSLTDPSVFDFYNQLLDGPTKKEWQNFRTYNLSLAQTFFNDRVGFDASYNREWFKSGQLAVLDGNGTQSIGIDMSSAYPDGLTNGLPDAGLNGTPNPNVGRAYLSSASQWTNNSYLSNRETMRLTVFGRYNFDEGTHHNWFTKLLGEQTVTGLAGDDTQKKDNRSWNRWGADSAYELFIRNKDVPGTAGAKYKFNANEMTPTAVIYLGPSQLNASSASGLHLPNPKVSVTIPSGSVRTFDATWKPSTNPADPTYVDPAAFWQNNYYPPTSASSASTQSENPANYVGFRNVPINIIDSETSQANRDFLTHDAALSKSQVTSTAATWQGNFWQNAVVATWGVRKDISRAWNYTTNSNTTSDPFGHVNLSPSAYKLSYDPSNSLQITSHAWTVMTHLNQLPGLKKLPIQVSLYYNHSTDFQPASSRVDVYGEPLGPPTGVTKDVGILLETQDGKYSLKINKYENSSTNATSNALDGSWFIGSMQAWFGNWANVFEFKWYSNTPNLHPEWVLGRDWQAGQVNYAPAAGETQEQATAREKAAVAAWRTWQKSVDPRFYKAWGVDLNAPFGATPKEISASTPNGFSVTEDSVSKGYEIELNATPVKNWRLAVNASKTTAVRSNIGGSALVAFIAAQEKALNTTAAGDLRIWWGGLGSDNFALAQWNGTIGSNYALRHLQEGTNVPEMREWRFNAISNYSFDEGILKGIYVGGGVRYESDIVIGYKPIPGATPTQANFDLSNPYKGPAETNFDFWIGYGRKITHDIDWSIQLNVRNAFVGNELIPLTVQPDGSPGAYRIRPPQTWQLTNTFKF
jgi:outer membrane receptor protein involved in Fe transport